MMNTWRNHTSYIITQNTQIAKDLSYLPQNPWNHGSKENKSNILAFLSHHGSDIDEGGETPLDA